MGTMSYIICSALVVQCLISVQGYFGVTGNDPVKVKLDSSTPAPRPSPLCFESCVCDDFGSIDCMADFKFLLKGLEFNNFLRKSRGRENFRIHIRTSRSTLLGSLPELPMVRYLSLAGNRISIIPNNVFTRTRLRELNLSHNTIRIIEANAFQGMKHLRSLDLSHNSLTSVSKSVFANFPALEVLNLDSNQLMYFPFDAFSKVPSLQVLMLNNNNLSYLLPGSLVSLATVQILGLRNNNLRSFAVDVVEEMPHLKVLDVSNNPFHCSCALEGLKRVMNDSFVTLMESNQTTCGTPLILRGRQLTDVLFKLPNCTQPKSFHEYDSHEVLYISDVDVSCFVEGNPDPAILWYTPWGHQFAHRSHWSRLEEVCDSCKQQRSYTGIGIDLDSQVMVLDQGKSLRITNFRSFFNGNITCQAYNYLGTDSVVQYVKVVSPVKTLVLESFVIGGFSAGGFLCFGLAVGSIKLIVLSCLKCHGKKKKVVRTPTTCRLIGSEDYTNSMTEATNCKDDSIDFNDDFYPPETPFTTPVAVSPTTSPRKTPGNGQETPPGGWIPSNIMDTMEEVRWRLRYGMGRRMKSVKRNVQSIKATGKRNVQSIKESGSVYVHNIMETGSTAAHKVRAGVVMGMETVKYHVQSIKEFCGTGDMGTQTISMISVETNLDTNETKEVVKSITIV